MIVLPGANPVTSAMFPNGSSSTALGFECSQEKVPPEGSPDAERVIVSPIPTVSGPLIFAQHPLYHIYLTFWHFFPFGAV